MNKKLLIRGLSALLLLAQSVFVFPQTTPVNQNDALIALLDEPDAVAVVNVRKMLETAAPAILNSDPSALEKVKNVMKSIETETGVNPYLLEKIVFGGKLENTFSTPLIVMRSGQPSGELIEKMYQAQLLNAKFAAEINPLKNRIELLERRLEKLKTNIADRDQLTEEDNEIIERFQTDLETITPRRTEQVKFAKLKTDTAKLLELMKDFQKLEPTVYELGDLPERVTAVKTQTENISASDALRVSKTAAAEKLTAQIEKEFDEKRERIFFVEQSKSENYFQTALFPYFSEEFPETATARKAEFDKLQAALTEAITGLNAMIAAINSKETLAETSLSELYDPYSDSPLHPFEISVTRKDETIGGKKILLITTHDKFPENALLQPDPEESAILVYDEKTIILGDRATIAKTLETKPANANQIARNLISRSPDALIAFGADLRNINIHEFTDALGGQKNVWQIIGSLDSAGNDISLTVAFEKTDVPYNFPAPKEDSVPLVKTPKPPGGNAAGELMELMIKSIVGIEGKLTVRFDKQKTAAMIEKTPAILSGLFKR